MTIDTARRIAKSHPGASLPCPLCASSVKGENLASHITKVHANATPPPAAEPRTKIGTVPAWRGTDARILVTALLAMIPALIGAMGTLVLDLPRAIHAPFAIAFMLLLVIAFAALLRKVPARLALAENALVIRGLVLRRSVDIPCEIETGTLVESRPEAIRGDIETNVPSVDFDAGTYLRFAGPHDIVVACRAKAAHLGAARGPKRKKWDIELPREAFVALQYALLERGLLAVDRAAYLSGPTKTA
jgi:hypothetical protein